MTATIFTLYLDVSIITIFVQCIFTLSNSDKGDHTIYYSGKESFFGILLLAEKKETYCLSMYVISDVSFNEKMDDKVPESSTCSSQQKCVLPYR
jgi:hypothetical protein